MMLSDKKPVRIELAEKIGPNLWNLDIDYGQGFSLFAMNSETAIGSALYYLATFSDYPFNGIRLYKMAQTEPSFEPPQMMYTVPSKFLKSFVNIPV
jgi:hypothetical protein